MKAQASTDDADKKEMRIKAVESALEWSKQITTLATGTLVLSGTFIKDLFSGQIVWKGFILACWIGMGISVLFGILYLGSLCYLLSSSKKAEQLDIYGSGRIIGVIHVLTFFLGLAAFIVFLTKNLFMRL